MPINHFQANWQTFVWSHTPAFFFQNTYFCLELLFHRSHNVWKLPKIFRIFWHFSPIFVLFKVTCLVTLFDCKFQLSKFWAFLIDFCVNDILADFQTPWRTFLFYWGSLNLDFRRLIQEVRPPIKVTLIGFNVSPDDPALLLFCNQNSLTAWKYQAWNRSRSSSSMMNRCWLCPSWPHFFTSSLSKQEPRLKLSLIYSTISPQKMNQILLGMLSKQPV